MNNNCQEIETLIALAVSDDLTANERQQVDNHILACENCARLHAELTELRTNTATLKECELPAELGTQPAASPIRAAVPGLITVAIAALLVAAVVLFRVDNAEPARTAKTEESAPTVTASSHIEPKIAPPPPPRSALAGLAENPGISTNVIATINTKDPDIVILWMGD